MMIFLSFFKLEFSIEWTFKEEDKIIWLKTFEFLLDY